MKAIRFHQQGDVDVLKYEDAPEPSIGADDVLIRVRACALNHLDLWVRRALPVPLPHIEGSDVAGEVAALGANVTRLKVGDKVTVNPGLYCGNCEWCHAGEHSQCLSFKILGYQVDGGYAEYCKVPAVNVYPMPPHLSFDEAAAFPLVFLTAWQARANSSRSLTASSRSRRRRRRSGSCRREVSLGS